MQADTKQRNLEHIEKIMGLPQSQKWRAARDMLRAINPNVRRVDDEFIKELNDTRDNLFNDFGSNKEMSLRNLLDLPVYIYEMLITVDPDFLPAINSKDKQEETAVWRKLAEVFPEYKIARKI